MSEEQENDSEDSQEGFDSDQEASTDTEESTPSDTLRPTESHGFLEQFEALSFQALQELKSVVELGLQPAERVMLMKVSLQLMAIAGTGLQESDFSPEQKSEIETLIHQLELTSFQTT